MHWRGGVGRDGEEGQFSHVFFAFMAQIAGLYSSLLLTLSFQVGDPLGLS